MQNALNQPTAPSKPRVNALAVCGQFSDPYGVWQCVTSCLQCPGYKTEVIAQRRSTGMSEAHQPGKRSAARLGGEAHARLAPHGNHGDNKSWSAN